jgi:hypothetical protein
VCDLGHVRARYNARAAARLIRVIQNDRKLLGASGPWESATDPARMSTDEAHCLSSRRRDIVRGGRIGKSERSRSSHGLIRGHGACNPLTGSQEDPRDSACLARSRYGMQRAVLGGTKRLGAANFLFRRPIRFPRIPFLRTAASQAIRPHVGTPFQSALLPRLNRLLIELSLLHHRSHSVQYRY